MSPSDHALLRAYAHDGSQAAFGALVERHVNLVYSAARRQVRSPQLAEDVSQSVFLDLAREAATLTPATPLAAWLHLVTRRTAIDAIRRESRRAAREQQAAEIDSMHPDAAPWTAVEPLLDEAVQSLDEPDRTAVLLRYFENKSLREVGAALGTSDDAAQKRVSRALDHLRTFFQRRGVTVTAAGLATDLSAHAIQLAPAGLGVTISTAAAISGATGAIATTVATKAIAMTTFQKSIVATVLALAVGTGIYEATAFARQASELATHELQAATLSAQLRRAAEQQAATATRLKSVEAQIDSRLASGLSDAALESKLRGWQANLDQLRQTLKQRPNLSIPELQLLSDDDWFDAATKAKLDSDDDVRRTLASLREQATWRMVERMRVALNAYLKGSDGSLPDRIDQLLPCFNPPIEPTWLDRYKILHAGKLSEVTGRNRPEIVGLTSYADLEYDRWVTFGPDSSASGANAMNDNVFTARFAFEAAHGARAETAAQLLPYLKWPASESAVQKYLDQLKVVPARR